MGSGKYDKIVVNGKTGERVIPLIDSIAYVIQWISNHPQGSNREALLFPNLNTNPNEIQNQFGSLNGADVN